MVLRQSVQRLREVLFRDRTGNEIRRQGNGTRFGAVTGEMLEELANARRRLASIAHLDASRLRQPLPHLWLVQMKDQVIGAQAGHIAVGVEALQRIVEIVGQEDLLDIGLRRTRSSQSG